ncbi:MAG: HAMP domain-containing protein [Nitrospiraceae bacterium]|nr:HAMP domain-containing protein [Nitrospiraceae bacterium]
MSRLTKSLAFRLTAMYAALCFVLLAIVLGASYLVLHCMLHAEMSERWSSEIDEFAALLETQSVEVVGDVLRREAVSEGTNEVFYRVLDAEGNTVVSSDMSAWGDVPARGPALTAALDGETVSSDFYHENQPYPIRIVHGLLAPGLVLQMGSATAGMERQLLLFRSAYSVSALAFLVLSLVIGYVMARRALSGVENVTQAARDIASGAWESRVPVSQRDDEVDELAKAFNGMIERIQVLIRELREVTDDIAHDLRTPITRIRGEAEVVLGGEQTAGSVIEECDALLDLINTMLEISQTAAGAKSMDRERVDLGALVEDACELFRPAAEDSGLTLSFDSEASVVIEGDALRLKRAIAHLVDNAVKYTQSGGRVDVVCGSKNGRAIVSIEDTGAGIPPGDFEKVFARFYRVDASRTERGNGLGLSLSRAICRAHGGDVTVTSTLGEGSHFEVTLPLVAS